jgi:hypothetical protein
MDAWFENDLANAQSDLEENSFSFGTRRNVCTQEPFFILRGWGKTKTKKQNITEGVDRFKLIKFGPIRGFGRDGSFYLLFNDFLKSRKKNKIQHYNYWRGAGKALSQNI